MTSADTILIEQQISEATGLPFIGARPAEFFSATTGHFGTGEYTCPEKFGPVRKMIAATVTPALESTLLAKFTLN